MTFQTDLFAILLCLLSAITVAATNFFVKKSGDILTSRSVMSGTMALIALPFVFVVPVPSVLHFQLIGLSLLVHGFYQMMMIPALHRGDLSLVFPVMRGLGPLVVGGLAGWVLGEHLTVIGWLGLLLASGAVILFALPTQTDQAARALDRRALIFAVLTAVGIGAYSVTDAYVIRQLPSAYTFIVWLFLFDWVGVTIITLWRRRGQLSESYKRVAKDSMTGGVLGAVSFSALLYAFTITDAAIATALRETSVVWAALMGTIWLKEGFGQRRIFAACLLAIGLLLMQSLGVQ